MADYTKQIFNMLGVEPYETFEIQGKKEKFVIDNDLNILLTDERGHFSYYSSVCGILRGNYIIIKHIKPTAEEQLAIDYARACGCKWLVKDRNGDVYGCLAKKPKKINASWSGTAIFIHIPISFISWEDEETYYIGN